MSNKYLPSSLIKAALVGGLLLSSGPAYAQQAGDLATQSVVSLPMYEVSDSIKRADDIFWDRLSANLKAKGIEAPDALQRETGPLVEHWQEDGILLSQTCGFPYLKYLMSHGVKIVATPVYASNDGLSPGDYQSVIIVRDGTDYETLADLKGKTAGFNQRHSNSGFNVFRAMVASTFAPGDLQAGIFDEVVETGGHFVSVNKVADGEIDVAAIDQVTYDLIQRHYPELAAKTRVLAKSEPSPGLPLITSAATDDEVVEKMRAALREVVSQTDDPELMRALKEMRLTDFVVIDADTYRDRLGALEEAAVKKGYPELK